jgi:hypothetical protein
LADVIVGVAQLFSLGHETLLRFFVSQIGRRRFSAVRFFGEFGSRHFGRRTARADSSAAGKCGSIGCAAEIFVGCFYEDSRNVA